MSPSSCLGLASPSTNACPLAGINQHTHMLLKMGCIIVLVYYRVRGGVRTRPVLMANITTRSNSNEVFSSLHTAIMPAQRIQRVSNGVVLQPGPADKSLCVVYSKGSAHRMNRTVSKC